MRLQRRELLRAGSAAALGVPALRAFAAASPGIGKNELVIGSIQDLSGPLVSFSKPVRDGMVMRVDQANAQGGVQGRKIKLVIEDSAYDTKKAVLAADKLTGSDKVFAMVGTMGATPALATIQTVLDSGALHLFPVTSHHSMFEPFHRLKFAAFTPYPDSTRAGLKELIKRNGYKRVAIHYQDDEFGLDVLNGTEAALKESGLTLVERTTYKRGATDFSSQMQKQKAANPDLIVLATIIRETIGSTAEARKIGYAGDFFGSQGSYIPATPKIGGKAVDGLYNVCEIPTPYRDDPGNPKLLNDWLDAYKARFGEAELGGVFGWSLMDMFVRTADKAGPALTTDAFVKALEGSTFARSFLGTPEISFSASKRLGNNSARVAQIRNGRWVNVTDFVK